MTSGEAQSFVSSLSDFYLDRGPAPILPRRLSVTETTSQLTLSARYYFRSKFMSFVLTASSLPSARYATYPSRPSRAINLPQAFYLIRC
jgi:hypothetical protein